jgi:hypothetical protein
MSGIALPVHGGLADHSRMRVLNREQGLLAAEIPLLLLAGAVAALATVFLEFRLRIPGHAIVRAVLPMAAGLALAPLR